MKLFCILIFLSVFAWTAAAQSETDTIPPKQQTDTQKTVTPIVQKKDTQDIPLPVNTVRDTTRRKPVSAPQRPDTTNGYTYTDTSIVVNPLAFQISRKPLDSATMSHFKGIDFLKQLWQYMYENNFMIGFATEVISAESDMKVFKGKELLFYYVVFLFLLFGFLRQNFGKYFYDLFRVFFRTSMKQRQISEQLLQSPLPSVLTNGFFVLSAGFYLNLLLVQFGYSLHPNFWMQYLYCIIGLASIYTAKYLGLQITGWIFNVRSATDAYTFIVFMINKMIGILLLPFIALLSFTSGALYEFALNFSILGIGAMLIYRLILSYGAVRNEITLNPFHFFLYLLAFEVIPLFLIYKLLLTIF